MLKYKSANKDADARSDVKVEGFWSKKRQAFFDVKVVSPFAKSYAHMTPAALFRLAEKEKISTRWSLLAQVVWRLRLRLS